MEDNKRKEQEQRKAKAIFRAIGITMLILFACSSIALGGESEVPFNQFFKEYGMDISFVVCFLWVMYALIDIGNFKVQLGPLALSSLFMIVVAGRKFFHYKTEITHPDDLLEIASIIILVAAAAAYFVREAKEKE